VRFDLLGLAGIRIVKQKGTTALWALAATEALLALRGLALPHNVGPVVVWTVQDSRHHNTSRSDGSRCSSNTLLKKSRSTTAQHLPEQFLAENKQRVELGLLPPIELIQAEARIKTRQADTIQAAAAVRTAEDQLKEVLNIPGFSGTWQIRLRPSERPPFTPAAAISLEEQVEVALKKRPDFVRSQLNIATREIARNFARNQRLPRLDIVSNTSVQAFGAGFDESAGRLRKAEGYAWAVGLRFEQPLGNRSARSELLKRNLELQQAQVDQQRLLLTIIREVA